MKKLLKLPIRLGLAFAIFTLALYFFGPYDYGQENLFIFVLFITCCFSMMYIGFVNGTSIVPKVSLGRKMFPIKKVLNIMFIISLLISIPRFMIFTRIFSLNPSLLLGRALLFFSDAGTLYTEKILAENVTGIWVYINYLVILLSPIYWGYSILSMLLWRYLSFFKKVGSLFIYVLWVLQYLCTATNVGLFNFIITFVICYISRDFLVYNERKINVKKYSLYLGGLMFLLGLIFSISMGSRIGDDYMSSYSYLTKKEIYVDESRFLWIFTPDAFKPVLCYFTRYLAIPYQALMLSFNLDWSPTFGCGHSWFFLDQFPNSQELWSMTYNMKLDQLYGYSYFANWHTPFVWFANDVSFWGVPIILYYLFYFFGSSWKRFLYNHNLASFLVFMLFVNMICFISANNQVFQNSETCIAFYLLLFFNKYFESFNWEYSYGRK